MAVRSFESLARWGRAAGLGLAVFLIFAPVGGVTYAQDSGSESAGSGGGTGTAGGTDSAGTGVDSGSTAGATDGSAGATGGAESGATQTSDGDTSGANTETNSTANASGDPATGFESNSEATAGSSWCFNRPGRPE